MAIQQKFTGDASQLEKEYNKILQAGIKMEGQLHQMRIAADKAAKQQQAANAGIMASGKKALTSVKNLVAGYLSAASAIRLVVSELKAKEALEAKANQTTMSVGDAQAQVAINIGDVSDAELQSFLGKMSGVRRDTGFQSEIPLLIAASTTLSATAGDQKLTADILRNVAPLFKSAPDDLAGAAQVVGDLAQLSEGSAKETVGLVLATMGQARVTNLQAFKNVAPAIAAGVATQQNIDPMQAAKEAAAAFAAIGNQIKDPEGALTKTAVTGLSVALERNFTRDEERYKQAIASGASVEEAQKQSALSFAQRLDRVQDLGDRVTAAIQSGKAPSKADLATQADMISKGFEGPVVPVIKQLIAGNDTKVAAAFDAALSKISPDVDMVDRKFAQLARGTSQMEAGDRSRQLAGDVEGAFLSSEAARQGFIRDQMTQALATPSNLTGANMNQTLASWALSIARDKEAEALDTLTNFRSAVKRGGFGMFAGAERPDSELDEIDRNQIAVIEKAMDNIREFSQRNQRQGSAAVQSRMHDERD